MKRELGDVLWYWVQGCIALGFTPDEVMDENIRKLESRYPNGFEVVRSEVRAGGYIMAKKKTQTNLEQELSKYKHSLELVRTVVPILVLVLQVFILGRVL